MARETFDIPLKDIFCDNDFNCRGKLTPQDVTELIEDIPRNGLMQPIYVQPYTKKEGKKYRIIAGHRRYTAFKYLHGVDFKEPKWATIECFVRDDLDIPHALLFNLKENLDRKELNIAQEAKAIKSLMQEHMTEQEIASEIQRTRGWVHIRVMLLTLPVKVQAQAAVGLVKQSHVLELAQIYRDKGEDATYEAVRLIKEARERGETIRVAKAQPKPVTTRKQRSFGEIRAMLLYMMRVTNDQGCGLATKVLSWAIGNSMDIEVYDLLDDYCKEQGIPYASPSETDFAPHLELVGARE